MLEAITVCINRLLAGAAERELQGVQEAWVALESMVAREHMEEIGMGSLLVQVLLVEMEEMVAMVAMVAQGALVPSQARAVREEQADLEDPGDWAVKVPLERDGGQTATQVLTVCQVPQARSARPW